MLPLSILDLRKSHPINRFAQPAHFFTYRLHSSLWTTDKEGIILALLAAEITARMKRDLGEICSDLTREFRNPDYERIEVRAIREQKIALQKLSAKQINTKDLAGVKIHWKPAMSFLDQMNCICRGEILYY